jgi:hypothetical protein
VRVGLGIWINVGVFDEVSEGKAIVSVGIGLGVVDDSTSVGTTDITTSVAGSGITDVAEDV